VIQKLQGQGEQNSNCNRYSNSLDLSYTEAQEVTKHENLVLEIKKYLEA
jgi:hypothetical protein